MRMQLSRLPLHARLVRRKPVRAGLYRVVVAAVSEVSVVVAVSEASVVVAAAAAVDSCRKEQQWQNYVLSILRVRLATRRIKKRPSGRLASANCSRRLNMKISLLYVE